MHKGDTCKIILDYKYNDHDIQENEMDDIEIQLGKQKSLGSLRLLLSEGRIEWDSEINKYVGFLTQEETFKLPISYYSPKTTERIPYVECQVRFYIDDCCVGDDIRKIAFKDTLSRKILGVE